MNDEESTNPTKTLSTSVLTEQSYTAIVLKLCIKIPYGMAAQPQGLYGMSLVASLLVPQRCWHLKIS